MKPAEKLADEFPIIGVAVSYDDLRRILRERRQALGLTHLQTDEIAGLQSGYTGKLEIGTKNFGPMSLSCMIGALGVKIVVVPAGSLHQENASEAIASAQSYKKLRSKIAAKGGRARMRGMTLEQRRAHARKAAKKRWRDWRAIKAEQKSRDKRANRKTVPVESAKGATKEERP